MAVSNIYQAVQGRQNLPSQNSGPVFEVTVAIFIHPLIEKNIILFTV